MKEKISITLDENMIKDIDKMVDGTKIKNRSHAIETLVSRSLGYNRPKTAIFLLGGKGTRFRPITYEVPKALLPIQGKTVPEHLFDLFKKYGIKRYIFSTGYLADKVKEYFGDGSKWGVEIIYVVEDEPLGSAGAIKLARKYVDGPFIITNGDEVKDIDLEDMYQFHKDTGAKITAALTTVEDPSAYGVAAMKGNKILKFVEKPKKEDAPSNLINSGLSIWEPSVFDMIPEGFSMYEQDVFPILAEKEELYGYIFGGQWFDTGTPERFEKARIEWKGITK
jgi:NDP-sugar pyrophosphorylase family protein